MIVLCVVLLFEVVVRSVIRDEPEKILSKVFNLQKHFEQHRVASLLYGFVSL